MLRQRSEVFFRVNKEDQWKLLYVLRSSYIEGNICLCSDIVMLEGMVG